MSCTDHPAAIARWSAARAEGAAADAGYSRTEYALTLHIGGRLVTFAACRFDDPAGTLRRVRRFTTHHHR